MTANEIVKALRECADPEHWDCQGCEYEYTMTADECRNKFIKAAADLIEQQQAEIKQLGKEWEEAVCTATEFESQVYELQKEIERLKAEVPHARKTIC